MSVAARKRQTSLTPTNARISRNGDLMMNANKWPPIEDIDPLIDTISERLIGAEVQLRRLAEIKETGYYDDDESHHIVDLLKDNLDLENDIADYADTLRFWASQEEKTVLQQGDISYAFSRLNRLSIVNINIILVSKRYLEHVESAETLVSGMIKQFQENAR